MEMQVREQALPGVGIRYEVDVGDGRRVLVIACRDGRRELGVTSGGDAPQLCVALGSREAVAIGALLLGARFTVDQGDETRGDPGDAVVDVVELVEGSSAVGKSQAELGLGDPTVIVLAVMSGTTPALVESRTAYRCQPGDRVVLAARAGRIAEAAAALRGPAPRVARTSG